MDIEEILRNVIIRLEAWLVENDYKAYDPFDGLNAKPFLPLRRLTRNNKYINTVLQQTVRRFPINLRRLLGISRERSTKGMGFIGKGYLHFYLAEKNDQFRQRAIYCFEWLLSHASPGYSGLCWGNHFDYQSRGFYLPKGAPTIVWTALIGQAFLDAYETLQDERYLKAARSACNFILNDLGRYEEEDGAICFDYIPGKSNQVHNANVLGAALLARTYRYTQEATLKEMAARSIHYTLKYQCPDGSWYYGEHNNMRWVDNFHSGYVLDSIKAYIETTGDTHPLPFLRKGYEYYKSNFFLEDGTPKYYNDKVYPIDIQCPAQAIETLIYFRDLDCNAIKLALKVAEWTIQNMRDPSGYFYFRKYRLWMNKTPMLHWGQGTMFSALSHLYRVLTEERRR